MSIKNRKGLYIDGKIWARPSNDGKALRAQCGFITGFPSDSISTITLHSYLVRDGHAQSKGRLIEYK